MKKDRRNQTSGWLDKDQKRRLQVLSVPLIVLILILLIKFVDRPAKVTDPGVQTSDEAVTEPVTSESPPHVSSADGSELPEPGEEPPSTEELTEPVTEAMAEPATTDAYATDTFQKDSIQEISELMKSYFQARAIADAETMNQLYGIREMSVTELEAKRSRMRTNAKYVTDFQNVSTYVRDGVTADSWLVYAVADIKFRSVKTTAPMVMYCYVTKDGEGNYRIVDTNTLSPQVLRYIEEANRTDEVRRLSGAVSKRLKEALEADADLKAVYGTLQANSPAWGDEYQESVAEVRIMFEEEGEESAAETTEGAAEETSAATEASEEETTEETSASESAAQ